MSETSRKVLELEDEPWFTDLLPHEQSDIASTLAREVEALESAQRWRRCGCMRYLAELVRLCSPEKLPAKWGELVDRDAVVDAAMNIKRILESDPPKVTP